RQGAEDPRHTGPRRSADVTTESGREAPLRHRLTRQQLGQPVLPEHRETGLAVVTTRRGHRKGRFEAERPIPGRLRERTGRPGAGARGAVPARRLFVGRVVLNSSTGAAAFRRPRQFTQSTHDFAGAGINCRQSYSLFIFLSSAGVTVMTG